MKREKIFATLRLWAVLTAFALPLQFLFPAGVYANASPVYLENYPAFSIAPRDDSPLVVLREELSFKMGQYGADQAWVTACYFLKNTSRESIKAPLVFPIVSEGYPGKERLISLDGRVLDYRLFSAGSVDVRDYLQDPEAFSKQVQIDTILDRLEEPRYEAQNFDDAAGATLYEITFQEPVRRQINIKFRVDPDKTRVLIFGLLNGFSMDQKGNLEVFGYVDDYNVGKKGWILVLGEDTLENFTMDSRDGLKKSRVTAGVFIRQSLLGPEDPWYLAHTTLEDFYPRYLKKVDLMFSTLQLIYSHDTIIGDIAYRNNISVLLFEVALGPMEEGLLEVAYPLTATIDRQHSRDYINTFAYILNPAQNFKEFGNLDIRIELGPSAPYIIASSLPLQELERGVYTASLDGLPDEDLVFSTYPHPEVTFWDRAAARILPRGYGMGFVLGLMAVLFLMVMAYMAWRKRRKGRQIN